MKLALLASAIMLSTQGANAMEGDAEKKVPSPKLRRIAHSSKKRSLGEELISNKQPSSVVSSEYKYVQCKGMPKNSLPDFVSTYDEKTRTYIYLESVNDSNVHFWTKRIGYEAYALLNQHLRGLAQFPTELPYNQRTLDTLLEARRITPIKINELQTQNYDERLDGIQQPLEEMLVGEAETSQLMKIPTPKNLVGYLGALNGFYYNLEKYKAAPTMIAYSSPKFFDKSIFLSEEVISTDINMMMTVRVDEDFYSPLGIFRSYISDCLGTEQKSTLNSIQFHSDVANLLKTKVNNNIKYMLVRPLEKMEEIFKKSGIPLECRYTDRNSFHMGKKSLGAASNKPTVTIGRWFDDDSLYTVKDPITQTAYKIGSNHWFAQNPYSGDRESSNPLITMSVDDLVDPSSVPPVTTPAPAAEAIELSLYNLKRGYLDGILETEFGKFSVTKSPGSKLNFDYRGNEKNQFFHARKSENGDYVFSQYLPNQSVMMFPGEPYVLETFEFSLILKPIKG